jgi:hypothetical protein
VIRGEFLPGVLEKSAVSGAAMIFDVLHIGPDFPRLAPILLRFAAFVLPQEWLEHREANPVSDRSTKLGGKGFVFCTDGRARNIPILDAYQGLSDSRCL